MRGPRRASCAAFVACLPSQRLRGCAIRQASKKKRVNPPKEYRNSRRAEPRRLDLLIIECDASKLEVDGLAVARATATGMKLVEWLAETSRGISIKTVKATDHRALLAQLADVKASCGTARAVLIIGHSNVSGIRLVSDLPLIPWSVVGKYLEPFAPNYIALLACQAGARQASASLVAALPGVREVAASPAGTTSSAVLYLGAWLLMKLHKRRVPSDLKLLGQGAMAALGMNVVVHWTRAELLAATPGDALIGDLMGGAASEFIDAWRRSQRRRR